MNKSKEFEMEYNEDEIIINSEELPENLHQKYLKIYKEHFDKELEGDFNIRN
ncbi:hypothetical protein ACFLS9_08805 [Bacteroidota bacterium]